MQRSDEVLVLPHNPQWFEMYFCEAQIISEALGANTLASHHIGSTAIPNCYAKPIVDILVEAEALSAIDTHANRMEQVGYQVMGEYGIPGRRYFRKDSTTGVRLFHVHVFTKGDVHIERHLAFRDFLIQHPDWAQDYSQLKRKLAFEHANSSRSYTAAKTEFVMMVEKIALDWRRASEKTNPDNCSGAFSSMGLEGSEGGDSTGLLRTQRSGNNQPE